MSLSRGLYPSLRGALAVVVTVVIAIAIAATVASATMMVCDRDEVGVYAADNGGTDATAE